MPRGLWRIVTEPLRVFSRLKVMCVVCGEVQALIDPAAIPGHCRPKLGFGLS
jgi:hypothetical protein